MFGLIHLRGLPSNWILTSWGSNPNSDGRSDKSLLDTSSVLSFFRARISPESFSSLLSARMRIVRLGQLPNLLNSFILLKFKLMLSSLSETGTSSNFSSLFYFIYSPTSLLHFIKEPASISLMLFLFKDICSMLEVFVKYYFLIVDMLLLEASRRFKLGGRLLRDWSLLLSM